ncbi:MAG: hypothetical protein ABL929_07295 [Ferruginibacter sp.]
MKKTTLILVFIAMNIICFSQEKNKQNNSVSLSMPVIWNNSNGIYYSLGNKKTPTGKASSYGIVVNYNRLLHKNWYTTIGVGYYKQSFNIIRPFEFDGDTVTNLLYSTKQYNYHCVLINLGFGYSYSLNTKVKLNGAAAINLLNSFKQNYTPTNYSGYQHKTTQTNTRKMPIGYIANISLGAEYLISKKISVGIDALLPFVNKWKYDVVFIKSGFGDDSQIIAENKFSFGTAISCKYHF